MKRILMVMLLLLSLSNICLAETREIISESAYNMGDGETPQVAEERAIVQAKQQAIEQAGVYLESYSEVNNLNLVKDEIRIISSGLMSTVVLDKSRTMQDKGGIQFWVKIKATITTDNINNMVNRIREMSTTNRYNEVVQKYDLLQNKSEPVNNEKQWLSNYWLDIGIRQYLVKDYDNAITSLTKSYYINPSDTASIMIGDIYYSKLDYSKDNQYLNFDGAMEWYGKATQSEETYFKIGLTYEKNKNDPLKQMKALKSYSYIIENINDMNPAVWTRMGYVIQRSSNFFYVGNYPDPLICYARAISLSPNYNTAYQYRGMYYEKLNKPYEASQDYKKFLDMTLKSDPEYKNVEDKLQNLKTTYGIM